MHTGLGSFVCVWLVGFCLPVWLACGSFVCLSGWLFVVFSGLVWSGLGLACFGFSSPVCLSVFLVLSGLVWLVLARFALSCLLSSCLAVCLSSVCLSVCLSVFLCLSFCVSVCLPLCLLSVCLLFACQLLVVGDERCSSGLVRVMPASGVTLLVASWRVPPMVSPWEESCAHPGGGDLI